MNQDKPFLLRILPLGETDYGLQLDQYSMMPEEAGRHQAIPVVKIWGIPFRSVLDLVLETVKRNGYRATDLRRTRQAPMNLNEAGGVRLGLLFLAVKPLKKTARIESVSRAIKDMALEEAYYWYSKLTKTRYARRAGRALRILLAEE